MTAWAVDYKKLDSRPFAAPALLQRALMEKRLGQLEARIKACAATTMLAAKVAARAAAHPAAAAPGMDPGPTTGENGSAVPAARGAGADGGTAGGAGAASSGSSVAASAAGRPQAPVPGSREEAALAATASAGDVAQVQSYLNGLALTNPYHISELLFDRLGLPPPPTAVTQNKRCAL